MEFDFEHLDAPSLERSGHPRALGGEADHVRVGERQDEFRVGPALPERDQFQGVRRDLVALSTLHVSLVSEHLDENGLVVRDPVYLHKGVAVELHPLLRQRLASALGNLRPDDLFDGALFGRSLGPGLEVLLIP